VSGGGDKEVTTGDQVEASHGGFGEADGEYAVVLRGIHGMLSGWLLSRALGQEIVVRE
jgi:hypothetical protein